MIGFIAILNMIIGPVLGFFFGKYFYNTYVYYNSDPKTEIICEVVTAIFGLLVAFIFDVVIFGYRAQILDIRRNVERIQKRIGDKA